MSFRMSIATIAVALVAVSGTCARADEESSEEIISELFDVLQYEKLIDDTATMIADQLLVHIRGSTPDLDAETESAVRDLILQFYLELEPEMERVLSTLLVKHFTKDELRAILAFHKSEIGMKWIQLTPILTQEILPLAQQWTSARIPQMLEEIEALVTEAQ